MAQHQSVLTTLFGEVLAAPDLAHSDEIRRMLQAGLQELINVEATVKIGAATHERTAERTTTSQRHPTEGLASLAGYADLAISKLREDRSSRACCTHAAASTRRSTR